MSINIRQIDEINVAISNSVAVDVRTKFALENEHRAGRVLSAVSNVGLGLFGERRIATVPSSTEVVVEYAILCNAGVL